MVALNVLGMAGAQSASRRKTVTRTFRISKEVNDLFENDATDKRLSVNTLVNTIFSKYAEWDRFAEKCSYISMCPETFSVILEEIADDKIEKIARELGSRVPKDFMAFWFQKLDISAFLAYLSLICQYGGMGNAEVRIHGNEIVISDRHTMGQKWSTYIKFFMAEAMRTLFHVNSTFDTTKNMIIMRFPVPTSSASRLPEDGYIGENELRSLETSILA